MTDVLLGHPAHRLFNSVVRSDGGDVGRKDVAHTGGVRSFSLKGDFPGVIPFGKNANKLVPLHDRKGADVFPGQ